MNVTDLPALNATLNAAATVFIVAGLVSIKLKKQRAHIAFMATALVVSTAFLVSYVIYHVKAGHVPFNGKGIIRPVYFALLISHVLLAIANVPLVLMTVVPALKHRFDRHKRMAKLTAPVWLYVSVTGVLVYLMCYIWFA